MAAITCWHLHNYTLSRLWKTLTFIWGPGSCHLTDTEAFILLSPLFWSHLCDLLPTHAQKTKKTEFIRGMNTWTYTSEWCSKVWCRVIAKLRKRFLCSWNIKIVNKIRKIQSICSVCCMYLRASSETERLVSSCNGKSKNITTCLLLMVHGPAVIAFAE